MKVSRRSRIIIRIQNILFVALFLAAIGMVAWLSTRYVYQTDWTAGGRNTLSETSRRVLQTIDGPIRITAFASENDALRKHIADIVARYQRYKSDIELDYVNPETDPERTRTQGISVDGELVIEFDGRSEKLQELTEQGLTNVLQRVTRQEQRWIVFLEGHGERNPNGQANHDLGLFARELTRKGLTVQTVNLAQTPSIPANTSVLVIAGPQVELLPGEVELIDQYVQDGGNLLWLGDPGTLHGLQPIAERLGVRFLPGLVVDANTQLFGIQNPAFALVAEYPNSPLTRDFQLLTLFPQASALELSVPEDWETDEFLRTLPRSWTETGELSGEIRMDPDQDERAGPLTIGVSLAHTRAANAQGDTDDGAPAQQRIVVTGDGDFLSNAYLGNGGNLNLGLNVVNWLSHDDSFVAIPAKTAPDQSLNLSTTAVAVIGFGFLIILPLTLVGAGLGIWLRRRKR